MTRDPATTMEQAKRVPNAGSWKPGQSGNPRGRAGRATSLIDAIRAGVDVAELVGIALKLAREGDAESTRLGALAWLRDSGFIKPAERHELAMANASTDDEPDLSMLSIEQLRELQDLERRRDEIIASGSETPALVSETGDLAGSIAVSVVE